VVATFRKARKGGLSVTFDATEDRLLQHIFRQMLELIGPAESGEESDPLAAALGIGTSTTTPDDPALARLFPDGYTDDDEASADFRRYTEPGLREQKRVALETAVGMLGHPGERIEVSPEAAEQWLRALNDTRLVLGQRLDISEDWDEVLAGLAEDDARLPLFWIYDRLTYLEESLVQALW
jgi:hypothetical protein